jgi:hypothetical protein
MEGTVLLEKNSGDWTYLQAIPVLVSDELTTKLDKAQTGLISKLYLMCSALDFNIHIKEQIEHR